MDEDIEDLQNEIRRLNGRLESANRKVYDLEHKGLHRLALRELEAGRNLHLAKIADMYCITSAPDRVAVKHETLSGAISEAWAWDES